VYNPIKQAKAQDPNNGPGPSYANGCLSFGFFRDIDTVASRTRCLPHCNAKSCVCYKARLKETEIKETSTSAGVRNAVLISMG
jgi:hypothetical protein